MEPHTVHITDSVPVVELLPRIDSVTSADLESCLNGLIDDNQIIICDFSSNTYISSLGLRVLLTVQKKMKKTGGTLLLSSLSPYVREIFDISGFSRIFSIYPSESEALQDAASHLPAQGGS